MKLADWRRLSVMGVLAALDQAYRDRELDLAGSTAELVATFGAGDRAPRSTSAASGSLKSP